MLDKLLSLGPSQVVLKAGDQGAWYADGAERGFCPCYPAAEIDPVGAGDAFCAGLLSGLLDGLPLRDAVGEHHESSAIEATQSLLKLAPLQTQ